MPLDKGFQWRGDQTCSLRRFGAENACHEGGLLDADVREPAMRRVEVFGSAAGHASTVTDGFRNPAVISQGGFEADITWTIDEIGQHFR